MGSWSVYCGLSRISITSGNKCVLLPIKKARLGEYLPYMPACLPIFGEYDDYGGIENIEKNANTELIERYFNCTIEDFCQYFTRGCIRDDEDDFPAHLKQVKELKDWTFMFIDRQVYDFLSTFSTKGHDGKGHLEYGNPKVLELLGFTYNGENVENDTYDPERFKHEWEFQGKKFYSDGTWLHYGNESIFNFENEQYSHGILGHITLPEDKMWIGEKTQYQLWKYMGKKWFMENMMWILGVDRSVASTMEMHEFILKLHPERLGGSDFEEFLPKGIVTEYIKNYETFGDTICELATIRHNMHCFSGHFEPHMLYVTPQCGEHELHQIILEKFAQINKSYIYTEE